MVEAHVYDLRLCWRKKRWGMEKGLKWASALKRMGAKLINGVEKGLTRRRHSSGTLDVFNAQLACCWGQWFSLVFHSDVPKHSAKCFSAKLNFRRAWRSLEKSSLTEHLNCVTTHSSWNYQKNIWLHFIHKLYHPPPPDPYPFCGGTVNLLSCPPLST